MSDTQTLPQLKNLRSALVGERDRLRRSIRLLSQAEEAYADDQRGESPAGGDQADIASDVVEQSMDLTLERIESRRLADVEAALRRLDGGTYGICDRCNHSIAMDRLIVMPWMRSCIHCSAMRQGGHGYPSA